MTKPQTLPPPPLPSSPFPAPPSLPPLAPQPPPPSSRSSDYSETKKTLRSACINSALKTEAKQADLEVESLQQVLKKIVVKKWRGEGGGFVCVCVSV